MPRGDKSSYTDKQKRQAEHIERLRERELRQGMAGQGNPIRRLAAGSKRAGKPESLCRAGRVAG